MYINPGELDKRIQIIKITIGEYDSDGFPIDSEEVIRTCYARVTDTSGSELIKANSEFSQAKRRFLIRYTDTEISSALVPSNERELSEQEKTDQERSF